MTLPSRPSRSAPLLLMAMDHRESFGRGLFGVTDDSPTERQRADMSRAKMLTFQALLAARPALRTGQAGVLVDERFGQAVMDSAHGAGVTLAVPIERSGRTSFEYEYGDDWFTHVTASRADYVKVLVRDNPLHPEAARSDQFNRLRAVSKTLKAQGIPLIYELLVPPTEEQTRAVRDSLDAYDRDLRPALVVQVITDNYSHEVEPALWKVEGLETADAARAVVSSARAGGRDDVDLIVLGRDAPAERLTHWLQIAAPVEGFVGYAIGRSIWEDAVMAWHRGDIDDDATVEAIRTEYARYASVYENAAGSAAVG